MSSWTQWVDLLFLVVEGLQLLVRKTITFFPIYVSGGIVFGLNVANLCFLLMLVVRSTKNRSRNLYQSSPLIVWYLIKALPLSSKKHKKRNKTPQYVVR
jgi:hypothetical protein